MKCPKCNGRGFVPTNIFSDNGAIKCDFCDGTGVFITNAVEPMTNEEWLRSCTKDEMVKTILDLCDYRPCFACGIGYCDDENWCHVYSDEAKEFVMEWLKQPHR